MTLAAGGLVDVADFGDTGWVALTLAAGITNVSGYDLSYRQVGDVVWLRGRVDGLVAATNTILNSTALPVGSRPGVPVWELGIIANGASTKARVWVTNSGLINARTDSGTQAFVFGPFIADA